MVVRAVSADEIIETPVLDVVCRGFKSMMMLIPGVYKNDDVANERDNVD